MTKTKAAKAKAAAAKSADSLDGVAGVSPMLVSDDSFFTAALSMIPAKHYLPADEQEQVSRLSLSRALRRVVGLTPDASSLLVRVRV